MIIFTLKKQSNGLYAVWENGIKVKNPIFNGKADFETELKALAFNKPYTIKVEDKKPLNDICENCHKNKVWHYNETVRKKGTENVKIMNICSPCFSKITGAK